MRAVYRCDEVERRLTKLPPKEHETLRATYERMLEKGPERFQVKPSGLPVMEHLYDEMPNFAEVLDDVRRQLALCQDSRDALEITPTLLLGPPGIGKTHFARRLSMLLGTGMGFVSMSSLTAGWVLSGASSQWKGARPGKVFETLVDGQYANPVMVVDEIDKASAEHAYDPLGALYSLLEIDTACSFTDEFAEVAIDASQVIWIATANDERAIPEPILNRMNVYEVEAPGSRGGARHRVAPVPAHPRRPRLGCALRAAARRAGARTHGRAGAARDAPRLDDRVRQRTARRSRRDRVARPARAVEQARADRLRAVSGAFRR